MRKLMFFSVLIFSFLAFPKTLLVPEEFLTIQHAVVVAQNGDTVSVNFGRSNGQRITVTTTRTFGKEITFEVRGERGGELLKSIKEMQSIDKNNTHNSPNTDAGWQGQGQVNDPDTLYDDCWRFKNIIFDNQNRPWVFWGGIPDTTGNMWAFYTYWNGQGWIGDRVAIAFPGHEQWSAYAHRATLGLDNQPYLVCNIDDPYNLNDIYYTRYNGFEWLPRMLVNLPDSNEYDFQPHIAANGNQMWVNWFGGVNTVSRYDIYMNRWNGNGWTPEELISSADYHNWFQNLAVDSRGNPHVVWIALDIVHPPPREDVIFYRHYDGNRWLEPETVMQGMLLYEGAHWSCLDIALDEYDNPQVFFDAKIPDEPSFDIFYTKKENGRWMEPMRITNDEYEEYAGEIAVSNSHDIWIVWSRFIGLRPMIVSHYDGQAWSSEMTIETPLSTSNFPSDLEFDRQGKLWLIYTGDPIGGTLNEIWYDVYSPQALEEERTQSHDSKMKNANPNPFSHSTAISYNLTEPSLVEVTVFDELGRFIKLLESGFKTTGSYTIKWDGKNQSGNKLPKGIYFICLKLNGAREVIPTVLIK